MGVLTRFAIRCSSGWGCDTYRADLLRNSFGKLAASWIESMRSRRRVVRPPPKLLQQAIWHFMAGDPKRNNIGARIPILFSRDDEQECWVMIDWLWGILGFKRLD